MKFVNYTELESKMLSIGDEILFDFNDMEVLYTVCLDSCAGYYCGAWDYDNKKIFNMLKIIDIGRFTSPFCNVNVYGSWPYSSSIISLTNLVKELFKLTEEYNKKYKYDSSN